MLKFQDVTNTDYHIKQINYYTKQVEDATATLDPMVPRCFGLLAQAAGRDGTTFTVEEWRKVSMGYDPFKEDWSRHKLRANATKLDDNLNPIPEPKDAEKKNRDGLELVFSSDKSISVWWAAQDKETQDRYLEGVNKIMEETMLPALNRLAMYEQDNQKLFANGLGFVSWFNHIESRGVDPYSHTHFNIKNCVKGLDGKYHALCTDAITKEMAHLDAVWQMAHATMLREQFGLKLESTYTKVDAKNDYLAEDKKNVFTFKVAGVSKALCKEYSKRSEEINAQLEKLGITEHSHQAYDAAALAQVSTRQQKTDLNATQLRDGWRTELAQKWNYTQERARELNDQAAPKPVSIPTDAELMESFDRRHMDVEFTEAQFKSHVYKQLMLCQSQEVIERRAEELFVKQALPVYAKGKEDLYAAVEAETNPHKRMALQHHLTLRSSYTARYFKEPEDEAMATFKAREGETHHQLDKLTVVKALDAYQANRSTKDRKFAFSAGQIKASMSVLTETGAVSVIKGMAGTGKTAVVGFIREQYEAHGMRVIGTATQAKAASGLLQEGGIKEGGNTAELLLKLTPQGDKPAKLTLTKNDVIILDEAGMTSGREICRLAEHVNRAGAKLVCIGDYDQLQAVGSSGLFRSIASRFTMVEMTDIQRQREDWGREMVLAAAAGKGHEAGMTLYGNGCISITEKTAQRVEAIARDYLADRSAPTHKFIVASLNEDADRINEEVQRQQLKRGDISDKLGVAEVEDADGYTRRFHVGERIVFTKKTKNNDPTQFNQANNADTGRVKSIEHRKGKLRCITVELDNGKELTLSPKDCRNLKLGSALTTHKSQGATVVNSYLFASNQMANLHQFYVQLSRHKENTRLYLSEDQVNKLAEAARLAKPAPAQQGWAHDLIDRDLAGQKITEERAKELRQLCETFQGCREYLNSHSEAYKADANVSRQKLMETKTMRDFVSLFEAYSKANHKKSTQELDLLSEPHQKRLEEVRQMLNAKRHEKSQPLPVQAPTQAPSPPMEVPRRKQAPVLAMV